MQLEQTPAPGNRLLLWAGDVLAVSLRVAPDKPGQAVFRTNLGRADVRRRELIAGTESGEPVLARDWHDIPMPPAGDGTYAVRVPLTEVGWFAGKACFIPAGTHVPEWPAGGDLVLKVEPAHTACANTVYTAFVRQFGASRRRSPRTPAVQRLETRLEAKGYAVIPPSGTFRDLARQLDVIVDRMGFRIVQLLPIHPTPTTYGRMGRYGSPFAARDLMDVDPALAEFDPAATPLEQFRELVDAVHARGARLFLDIPANHTGWASSLQIHHPDWFRRTPDGRFISPGAWGVVWEDLVELDYSRRELRAFIADVFLFWCGHGVDGFRCDAGYMIPAETWAYVVARVRAAHPDTVFLLEGLGGKLEVTEDLLGAANLDWAYSELFQTEDRGAMERYLPGALALAATTGPLIHFAETHDNNRLAARGETYARMRTALSALLSHQGAFGLANGVEWLAHEKIDVHGASGLNWGAPRNQVAALARLNSLLAVHPAFGPGAAVRLAQKGHGNTLAVVRTARDTPHRLLILANLDDAGRQPVQWATEDFPAAIVWDLLSGAEFRFEHARRLELAAGQVLCLTAEPADLRLLGGALKHPAGEPPAIARRRRNLLALRVRGWLNPADPAFDGDADALGAALTADPHAFCAPAGPPRLVGWRWPEDTRRVVMVPPGHLLHIRAAHPFRARLTDETGASTGDESIPFDDGSSGVLLSPPSGAARTTHAHLTLALDVFDPAATQHVRAPLLALAPAASVRAATRVPGTRVRAEPELCAVLTNGRGALAQVRAAWGTVRSQYDALLAVNADAHVPVDRQVFFTRCRAWLRHRGYSHAIDATCLDAFACDPGGTGAQWHFSVPCGMGRWVPLTFALALQRDRNVAHLTLTRDRDQGGLEDSDAVTIVLRPDVEWRSFHGKTKAYAGPEQTWPDAVQAAANGFTFRPTPADTCHIRTDHGRFNHIPEWLYGVAHPEETERGLEGASDLFSPGWFGIDLRGGGRAVVTASRDDAWVKAGSGPAAAAADAAHGTLPLADALTRALDIYVVRRDDLQTVIAGYPWFLDWGRDTLIVLRGLIAAGRTDDALAILREFGRFERQGTLPNMIRGQDDSNRDTTDAPLWFGVAAGDLMAVLGPAAVLTARCGDRPLRDVLVSIATHYRAGTPNGIHMDPASGLIFSPPHFTWMDTNFPAATPRTGYPVEIQALWIACLQLLGKHVDPAWSEHALHARQSLQRLFWIAPEDRGRPQRRGRRGNPVPVTGGWLADCLRCEPGTPATRATAEDALRPNQLLAITLGAVTARDRTIPILNACERLLVPGGIRSLADQPVRTELPVWRDGQLLNDPRLPYWGRYAGDEDTRRKPAYHNGTAWTWPFPLYAEAYVHVYGSAARATARALLGSATEVLDRGCLGQIPEILDGDAPHAARGCCAQAWGVSELLRVWRLLA